VFDAITLDNYGCRLGGVNLPKTVRLVKCPEQYPFCASFRNQSRYRFLSDVVNTTKSRALLSSEQKISQMVCGLQRRRLTEIYNTKRSCYFSLVFFI